MHTFGTIAGYLDRRCLGKVDESEVNVFNVVNASGGVLLVLCGEPRLGECFREGYEA